MTFQASDTSRDVLLFIFASGHVFARGRDEPREDGAILFFSTDTLDEAKGLIERHCVRARDRSGNYLIAGFDGEVDAIEDAAEMFRETWEARHLPASPYVARGAGRVHVLSPFPHGEGRTVCGLLVDRVIEPGKLPPKGSGEKFLRDGKHPWRRADESRWKKHGCASCDRMRPRQADEQPSEA